MGYDAETLWRSGCSNPEIVRNDRTAFAGIFIRCSHGYRHHCNESEPVVHCNSDQVIQNQKKRRFPAFNLRIQMQPAFLLALLLGIATTPAFADEPNTLVKPQILKKVIQSVGPAVATIRVKGRDGQQIGIGTGFVIDATGLIATNFHVITEGRPFTVEMPSGRTLPVIAVESSDRTSDLALLRVEVGDKKLYLASYVYNESYYISVATTLRKSITFPLLLAKKKPIDS